MAAVPGQNSACARLLRQGVRRKAACRADHHRTRCLRRCGGLDGAGPARQAHGPCAGRNAAARRGRRADPLQFRLRRLRPGQDPGRHPGARQRARFGPSAGRDQPEPARPPGADQLRRRPRRPHLRQRHVQPADHAGGRVPGTAGDAACGRHGRQRRVRHGGEPDGGRSRTRRHAAIPDRRADRDRGRRAHADLDRPVPAGRPRAALDSGPPGTVRRRARPGQGADRHGPIADHGRRGVDRPRAARRGSASRPARCEPVRCWSVWRRRRHDRVRGRRPPHHHAAAERRVPALPHAAALDGQRDRRGIDQPARGIGPPGRPGRRAQHGRPAQLQLRPAHAGGRDR